MNTHNAHVRFGKFDGQLLTRVPVSYLRWAVSSLCSGPVELSTGQHAPMHEAAKAEMVRRGERLQGIDVSHHAIDRASLYFIPMFRLEHEPNEGIASWLARRALAAWQKREYMGGTRDGNCWKVVDGGIKFVIEELAIPVVKTVESP